MYAKRAVAAAVVLACLLGAVVSAEDPRSPSRVILFSWDGAAYWITSRLLSEGRLPHLERLVQEGAWAEGMVSSFPTKTASGHAMIWTGFHGHTNGVTGNYVFVEPAEEYSRLERDTGYFSTALEADPLWVRTARAGLTTYTFHASQSYPFEHVLNRLSPERHAFLKMLYGYTGVEIAPAVLSNESTPTEPASGWHIPEARGPEAREFSFLVGDRAFWALFFDDPFDSQQGCDTLGIATGRDATEFVARVKPGLGERFSVPIRSSLAGKEVWYSLRLFELDLSGSRFLLYRSRAQEVALSSPDFPGAGRPAIEAFAGNAGVAVYRREGFGRPLYRGGSGIAEERYLETVEHATDQIRRQAEEVLRRNDYRLLILYSPFPDEVAHALVGYLDPVLPEYDERLAARLWPTLARAYHIQDDLLGRLMEHARAGGVHVLVVSDHGMAGVSRQLNVNVVLARAGLLGLTEHRSIDLADSLALYPPLEDAGVAVNTKDRKGGIVPLDEKPRVLAKVRRALEEVLDPETGARIIQAIHEPAANGLLQPGGARTGDLFLQLAPGYYPSARTDRDEVVSRIEPEGNHIFRPTRRDMLALCAAWGPRVPPGTTWGRIRAIDVAPTVLDLLGIPVPDKMPGESLLPQPALVDTTSFSR